CFLFWRAPWVVVAALGVLAILWLVVGLPPLRLFRQIFKLWGFTLFVIASYALTKETPEIDRWVHVPIWKWTLAINLGGMVVGAMMVARVVAVVLASQISRAG